MPKVMIAEDELLNADMIAEVLAESGYDVCGIARTVAEGIELGERHQPDLAIIDLHLADGGIGSEIGARLRRGGRLGVLYMTGYAGEAVLTTDDGAMRALASRLHSRISFALCRSSSGSSAPMLPRRHFQKALRCCGSRAKNSRRKAARWRPPI